MDTLNLGAFSKHELVELQAAWVMNQRRALGRAGFVGVPICAMGALYAFSQVLAPLSGPPYATAVLLAAGALFLVVGVVQLNVYYRAQFTRMDVAAELLQRGLGDIVDTTIRDRTDRALGHKMLGPATGASLSMLGMLVLTFLVTSDRVAMEGWPFWTILALLVIAVVSLWRFASLASRHA